MRNKKLQIPEENSANFLIYKTNDGKVRVETLIKDENIWLTQNKIAELFGVDRTVISKHLKNIFESNELDENSVCAKFAHTANDGKKYQTKFYNLDAIISVGYRVNSKKATDFRIWATQNLKEYMIKGFVIDDERLKTAQTTFAQDYFQELLERVRSIRASERRIYQKITDIFAECSTDYDPRSPITKEFFATVQNKFHFAITGLTAAEIIANKADHNKKNMGLKTWKTSPKGRILNSDVKIAKNYLDEKEIKKLERTISGFFDYIENLIENKKSFSMEEFISAVNKFISFNEYKVLDHKGKISKKEADKIAVKEYQQFNKNQKLDSDFDQFSRKLLKDKDI